MTFKIKDVIIKKNIFFGGSMKKILMLLLVCTLVFSLTFTMTSCKLLDKFFGDETTDETPGGDTPGGDENPGDNTPGIGSDMFDGSNGNPGIDCSSRGI